MYCLICFCLPAADKNGVSPNTISLPKGPGSIEGLGESFQPTLNTGTAKYSIALKLPPGTAGQSPGFSLSYEGGGGNGPLGFGWSLPQPMIQRRCDRGIPTYGADVGFERPDIFINDAKEELVPQTNGFLFCKNEGAFIRYRPVGDHWEATLPDGSRLEYGLTASARIQDDTNRVFAWLLEREADTRGNTILYAYTNFSGLQNTNQQYLAEIRYGPGGPPWANFHFVRFVYENRPDWFEDCRAGFAVRTGKRLKSIVIGTQGPLLAGHAQGDFNQDGVTDNLVRRYDLEYLNYAGTNSHWSLLASVRLVGADGVTALPAATFGYSVCDPPDVLSAAGHVLGGINEPTLVMDSPYVDFVDFNADGLPDVLRTGGPAHGAYLNRGETNVAGARMIRWEGPVVVDAGSGGAWNYGLDADSTHLADMNGDGLADLVHKAAPDSIFYFPNRGQTNWGERRDMSISTNTSPPSPFGVLNVRTADADFDKRTDLIRGDGLEYQVWFNFGQNQYSERITIPQEAAFDFSQPTVQIADLNGDRVPDIAKVRPSGIEVSVGLGYGRFASRVQVTIPDEMLSDSQMQKAKLMDINGDGLVDLVIERAAPGELWYWLNLGDYSLSQRKTITGMPTGVGLNTVIRWADVNGNGSTDLIYADSSTEPRLQMVDIGEILGCLPSPNTLRTISNGIGRVTLIGYEPSTKFALADSAAGHPWPDAMPFPVSVVASVTNLDSLGHAYATQFRYHNGYYDSEEKQFRGFARAEQIDVGDPTAPTLVTRSHFDTGRTYDSMKGKLLRLTAERQDGKVFWDDTTSWIIPPVPLMVGTNGVTNFFAHPTGNVKIISELGRRTPRRLESDVAYDIYGNQTTNANYGIAESGNRSAFDDERITATQYAINTNAWIIRTPKSAEIKDENGVLISRTEFFYDDETFSGNNLGIVTIGNLTMKREWIWTSTTTAFLPSGRTKYDTYGNPLILLDPIAVAPAGTVDFSKGHVRRVSYDSHFHTFPATETIHIGTNAEPLVFGAEYDPAFGVPLRAIDFNANITTFGYDSFGRLAQVARPGDASDFPSQEYNYVECQSVAGGGVVNYVETRLLDRHPGSAATRRDHYFVSRDFSDGMGRKLMTKVEAEEQPRGSNPRVVIKGAVLYNARSSPHLGLNPCFSLLVGDLDAQLGFESIEQAGWSAEFHENGQLLTKTLAEAPAARTSYDATLRIVSVTNPDGTFERTDYEPLVEVEYDENDTSADSTHFDTPMIRHLDGLGRLVAVDEIVRLTDTGESGPRTTWTTRYRYDEKDQLRFVDDSQSNRKEFRYDGLSRMIYLNDPDAGEVTFAYDDAGNVLDRVDAKRQRTTHTYDGANRILTEDFLDESAPFSRHFNYDPLQPISASNRADVVYFYDRSYANLPQGDNTYAAARNVRGRLAYVWDLAGEEHNSYDARGREEWEVKRVRDPIHGQLVGYKTTFQHDAADRLSRVVYPDNDWVDYEYNRRSLPSRVLGTVSGAIIEGISYLPSGQQATIRYGNSNVTTYAYDPRLRLKELKTVRQPGTLDQSILHYSYDFDPVSNIRNILDVRPIETVPAGDARRNTQTFAYDSLYRITSVNYSRNSGAPDGDGGSINYRYDRLGNLLSQRSTIHHQERLGTNDVPLADLGDLLYGGIQGSHGRAGRSPSAPPGPHALTQITNGVSVRQITYDANGNITTFDGFTCTWDFNDRLVAVENATMRAEYAYDYSDRRITKLVSPKPQTPVGGSSGSDPPAPARTCVVYVGRHFEVREHEEPVKYVWLGDIRVARVTKTLSASADRVQRIRLAKGWNLFSLAVDAPDALAQISQGVSGNSLPYRYDPSSEIFVEVTSSSDLPAGSVVWLHSEIDSTIAVRGNYTEPRAFILPAGAVYLPLRNLEPLELTLDISPPARIWQFDSVNQRWQFTIPDLAFLSTGIPRFIEPGAAVFVHSAVAVPINPGRGAVSVRYYHQDHLGSSGVITDANGEVVEEIAYYPFGAARNRFATRGYKEAYTFTQKESDAESSLLYFEARYLASGIARFLSVDPMAFSAHKDMLVNPQRLNPYAYGGNRPTVAVDPSGKIWGLLGKIVKIVVKGADIASTVAGIVDDIKTIASLDSRVGTGERLLAVASLVSEIASPVSLKDAKVAAKTMKAAVPSATKVKGTLTAGAEKAKQFVTEGIEKVRGLSKGGSSSVKKSSHASGNRPKYLWEGSQDPRETRGYFTDSPYKDKSIPANVSQQRMNAEFKEKAAAELGGDTVASQNREIIGQNLRYEKTGEAHYSGLDDLHDLWDIKPPGK